MPEINHLYSLNLERNIKAFKIEFVNMLKLVTNIANFLKKIESQKHRLGALLIFCMHAEMIPKYEQGSFAEYRN